MQIHVFLSDHCEQYVHPHGCMYVHETCVCVCVFVINCRTAMTVAREINDIAFVAQSCYSLGNTFTLMRNYTKAIEYHTIHLQYAQQLEDRYVCIIQYYGVFLQIQWNL